MRISDWSSDVCSSDLAEAVADVGEAHRVEAVQRTELAFRIPPRFGHGGELGDFCVVDAGGTSRCGLSHGFHPRIPVVSRSEERRVGKECVIRVDLGGRRIITKKKNKETITNID